jgi:hypothetical protein
MVPDGLQVRGHSPRRIRIGDRSSASATVHHASAAANILQVRTAHCSLRDLVLSRTILKLRQNRVLSLTPWFLKTSF